MSAIFKCNDGNEHDFDSNTESEYCAKGCGEKWAIYAIKKLGADLTEKDAEIEQLKKENLLLSDDRELYIRHREILIGALNTIAFEGSSREYCTKISEQALKEIGEI